MPHKEGTIDRGRDSLVAITQDLDRRRMWVILVYIRGPHPSGIKTSCSLLSNLEFLDKMNG